MTDGISTETIAHEDTANSRQVKKKLGSFYTPIELARLIATESMDMWFEKKSRSFINDTHETGASSTRIRNQLLAILNDIRILDPSVGEGVFLIAAAEWIERKQKSLGDRRSNESRRKKIIEESLYGVDISSTAIRSCVKKLKQWFKSEQSIGKMSDDLKQTNIKQGNSLVGSIDDKSHIEKKQVLFNWYQEFPEVMSRRNPGFDIILGNPPYGNILDDREREYIEICYPFIVGKNRNGTWNSAAHFIVRSKMLLREEGELALLIPNSILRVKQFTKTRNFLLENLHLWKIVDEGNPFEDVTLEMVSIFCENKNTRKDNVIDIESRRSGHEESNRVSRELLKTCRVFPIYHDTLFSSVLERGTRSFMIATRGRDIPKEHVRNELTPSHEIPYITSGRSVRRYHIDKKYVTFTDDWFLQDNRLRESYDSELLVATKNLRYPRCIIKPRGTIHGGGIVEIRPHSEHVNRRALGLILNSSLIQYICTRYLTNYSQLTTCLNTGILEDLPMIEPKCQDTYEMLFSELSRSYQNAKYNNGRREYFEKLSNALVYELYFGTGDTLNKEVDAVVSNFHVNNHLSVFYEQIQSKRIRKAMMEVHDISEVKRVERELQTFR